MSLLRPNRSLLQLGVPKCSTRILLHSLRSCLLAGTWFQQKSQETSQPFTLLLKDFLLGFPVFFLPGPLFQQISLREKLVTCWIPCPTPTLSQKRCQFLYSLTAVGMNPRLQASCPDSLNAARVKTVAEPCLCLWDGPLSRVAAHVVLRASLLSNAFQQTIAVFSLTFLAVIHGNTGPMLAIPTIQK